MSTFYQKDLPCNFLMNLIREFLDALRQLLRYLRQFRILLQQFKYLGGLPGCQFPFLDAGCG
jgi:hypothetical protein